MSDTTATSNSSIKTRLVLPAILAVVLLCLLAPFVISRHRIGAMRQNEAAVVALLRAYGQAQQAAWQLPPDPGYKSAYQATLALPGMLPLPNLDDPAAAGLNGYKFALLTGQDGTAPGGACSYRDEHGRLTRGFGVMAVPVRYGITGRNTYFMSKDGIFYVDLGLRTDPATRMQREFTIPQNSGQIQ